MAEPASTHFEQLDYIYMPSRDVAADAKHFTDVLGARLVFAIESSGVRVAMLSLSGQPPDLLLADHLEGDTPILIYRVDDLEATTADLEARGWQPEPQFGIPQGPSCSFETPGGHRLAIYELTRPGVAAGFAGRRDF